MGEVGGGGDCQVQACTSENSYREMAEKDQTCVSLVYILPSITESPQEKEIIQPKVPVEAGIQQGELY